MKHTGVLGVHAHCATCGWESEARNAVGNAAQHAQRTGHTVYAEQVISIVWNRGSGPT